MLADLIKHIFLSLFKGDQGSQADTSLDSTGTNDSPLEEKKFIQGFQPGKNEPCFCGSARTFSECCGSTEQNRQPPHGVVVIENALDAESCISFVEKAKNGHREWLKIGVVDPETGEMTDQRDKTRVTQYAELGESQKQLNSLVQGLWTDTVAPAFNVQIEFFEYPHILCYSPGGFYGMHADSDHFHESIGKWERVVDRDISMLLYLNSEFEGGALHFVNFNYRYQPRPGDLLLFPSDQRYAHRAEEVTSGERYSVVSWACVVGSERVEDGPSENTVSLV